MYDFLPHGGPLPPGYGDVYGAAPRAVFAPKAVVAAGPGRATVQSARSSQALLTKAWQASGKASSTSPLAIPDFDTWNVGAGMIEQVPAKVEETPPWYMNKLVWAAGGVAVLGLGYWFFLRNRGGGKFAAAVGA